MSRSPASTRREVTCLTTRRQRPRVWDSPPGQCCCRTVLLHDITPHDKTPYDITRHCVSPNDITYMYMYMYMYKVTYMYMCLYMYYMYTYSILYTYTAPVHVSHDLRHNISRHDVSRQSNHKKTHFKARQRPNEQAVHSEHWGHSHPMTSRSDGLEHSRRSPGNR